MEKYQKKPVVSRDEQLIRAALEMAVAEVENDHFEAAVSIRFIDPAEVLAKVGDERCVKCGPPRSNHPYRHPFVSMGDAQ